jgi:hypothetical protein
MGKHWVKLFVGNGPLEEQEGLERHWEGGDVKADTLQMDQRTANKKR